MKKSIIRSMLGALALTGLVALGACHKQAAENPPTQAAAAQKKQPALNANATKKPVAEDRSETQVMNCVMAGLKADGRTLAQARHLAVDTDVTIDGTVYGLSEGHSYYTACQGPAPQAQINALQAELSTAIDERDAALAEVARLRQDRDEAQASINELLPFVYIDKAGGDEIKNTWKDRAGREASMNWLQNFAIIALIFSILYICFLDTPIRRTFNFWSRGAPKRAKTAIFEPSVAQTAPSPQAKKKPGEA